MTTHDKIENLLDRMEREGVTPIDWPEYYEARAAIEADRKRRGEPVAWRWSESNGERWFDWTTDWSHHDRAAKMGCLIEYAAPSAPQPAESCASLMRDKTVCGSENGNCDSQPAEPVKSYLTVKYDDKGDCLYVCCDNNEPAEAEENEQGVLLRRAFSDGRLVGVTIPNFMGRYDEPVKVPSDADIDELSREWGLQSAAYPSKSMVRDFAHALLARYGKGTP